MSVDTKENAGRAPGGFPESVQQVTERVPHHVAAAQANRLRLTARCLSLSPVFVSDLPLVAELFNGGGEHVETWGWS